MTKLDKLIAKVMEGRKEFRFDEMVKLLRHVGYQESGGKGSHVVFTHDKLPPITLVRGPVIKTCYIEQIRSIIKAAFEDDIKLYRS